MITVYFMWSIREIRKGWHHKLPNWVTPTLATPRYLPTNLKKKPFYIPTYLPFCLYTNPSTYLLSLLTWVTNYPHASYTPTYYLPTYLNTCLSLTQSQFIYIANYLPTCYFVWLFVWCLSLYSNIAYATLRKCHFLSICLSAYLSVHLTITITLASVSGISHFPVSSSSRVISPHLLSGNFSILFGVVQGCLQLGLWWRVSDRGGSCQHKQGSCVRVVPGWTRWWVLSGGAVSLAAATSFRGVTVLERDNDTRCTIRLLVCLERASWITGHYYVLKI